MASTLDFKLIKSKNREDLMKLVLYANEAKKFDWMCDLLKEVVSCDPCLSIDERNLLSIAYKNVVGDLRNHWRNYCNHLESASEGDHKDDIEMFKKIIENDLKTVSKQLIEMLEKQILKKIDQENHEEHIFYLKMAGDYYRYLSETVDEGKNESIDYYKKAYEIAEKHLDRTHPTRLVFLLF